MQSQSVVIQSIQELSELETLKARVKELEQEVKAVKESRDDLAHELRTPANSMLASAEKMRALLSLENTRKKSKNELLTLMPELDNLAATILVNVDHQFAVATQSLEVSKANAGKIQLDITDFNVSEFLDGIQLAASVLTNQKGLMFALESKLEDEYLAGDATRLKQILLNLITNAVKFTEFGKITLEVKKTEEGYVFNVHDTGRGLTEDAIRNLFQAFSQVNASDGTKHKGAGLGLVVSKKYAQLMQGDITVTSRVGENSGSTFKVVVQLNPAVKPVFTPVMPVRKVMSPIAFKPLNILVAEDNAVNIKIITKLLKAGTNYYIVVARNGQEAVDIFKTQSFDLILMDFEMPEKDGIEATREIRALGSKVLIYGLSANVESEAILDKAKSCGMDGYFSKPLKHPLFAAMIEKNFPDASVPATPRSVSRASISRPSSPSSPALPKRALLSPESSPIPQTPPRLIGRQVDLTLFSELSLPRARSNKVGTDSGNLQSFKF